MMISLIHPSRSRASKAKETAKRWIEQAGEGVFIQHIFSLDVDDPQLDDYYLGTESVILINKNRSAVDAINNAAKIAMGDIFIVVSDDFDCPKNWALTLLDSVKDKTDWIAKTPDGIQKWIITLPIMDRAYYNRFGYIYFPDYLHMFCDTELTCVADLLGRKIDINIPFIHNNYSRVKDDVSIRSDATWNQGEKLFLERAKRNFDMDNRIGKITNQEYINWMRMKGVIVQ